MSSVKTMNGTVVMCSNCGKTIRSLKTNISVQLMVMADWGKVGDASYCKECIDTWDKRNGGSFESGGGTYAKNLGK